jgi:hypothetical protein
MATVLPQQVVGEPPIDALSGDLREYALDRWIYVITVFGYIVVTLTGFVPDSVTKLALIEAGQRPPFPLVAHLHAVVMASFLLFVLAQTVAMATGRQDLHRRIGPAAYVLAPALVVAGCLLAPATWHSVWDAAHNGPLEIRPALLNLSGALDNILLLQLRIGILFPLLLFLGLRARNSDVGFHKRMMIIAPAMALPAAFDRIAWIPHTLPQNPLTTELYPLLALAPLLAWDLYRNRRIHRAYWVFLAVYVPAAIVVHFAWNQPWWHQAVHRLMGV